MPELPEVQTTVDGLNGTVKNRRIVAVSTTYKSKLYKNKTEIKNPKFFKKFRERVVGQKILKIERRAKNILIHLSNKISILVHMKMTGYFFYNPPKNAPFIRLSFTLDNGKILALSDVRKFAKVTLLDSEHAHDSSHLKNLGPEPLDKNFQFPQFRLQILQRPRGKIKQVLMNQSLIAGIGNIYSDEILWHSSIHPLSRPNSIPKKDMLAMFKAIKKILKMSIDFGGDSMSDYRNIRGEKGNFQKHHRAYRQTGHACTKKGCDGVIKRMVIGARSTHFCPTHQKLFE